jgi:hypothetical protein
MMIYKVVDEQNHALYAFLHMETAQQEVEMLNESRDDHYFFVEAVEVAETV